MSFIHPDLGSVIRDPLLPTCYGFMLNVFADARASFPLPHPLVNFCLFLKCILKITILENIRQCTCPNSHLHQFVGFPWCSTHHQASFSSCQVAEFKPRCVKAQKLVSFSNTRLHWCFVSIYLISNNQVVETGSCVFHSHSTWLYTLCRNHASGRWENRQRTRDLVLSGSYHEHQFTVLISLSIQAKFFSCRLWSL